MTIFYYIGNLPQALLNGIPIPVSDSCRLHNLHFSIAGLTGNVINLATGKAQDGNRKANRSHAIPIDGHGEPLLILHDYMAAFSRVPYVNDIGLTAFQVEDIFMRKKTDVIAVTATLILLLLTTAAFGRVLLYAPGEEAGVSVYKVEGDSMTFYERFNPGEIAPNGSIQLSDFPEGVLALGIFEGANGDLFCAGEHLVADAELSAAIASAFTGSGPGTLESKIKGILPLVEMAAAGKVYLTASHAHIRSTGYGQTLNDGAVLWDALLYVTGESKALTLPDGFSLATDAGRQ